MGLIYSNNKRVYMEFVSFVFSKASRSTNSPTAYRVLVWTNQKTMLEKQGSPLILPQWYLKIEKVGEIEVVDVRDNVEPEVACQREKKSLVDENTDIFDTILVGRTIEAAKGKLEVLKDQGSDTCGVFKYFFHFFSVDQTPPFP